jgi:hypothetical protein
MISEDKSYDITMSLGSLILWKLIPGIELILIRCIILAKGKLYSKQLQAIN